MHNLETHLAALTGEEILSLPPGAYGDYELLGASEVFDDEEDGWDRAVAVWELILRSPEVAYELVAYDELYFEVIDFYRSYEEPAIALQWALAWIAHNEQHLEGSARADDRRTVAGLLLELGDLDTALGMYIDLIESDPGDLYHYKDLGAELLGAGLRELAVDVLEKLVAFLDRAVIGEEDPEGLRPQLQKFLKRARSEASDQPDRSGDVDPDILGAFRALLAAPPPPSDETRPDELPYAPLVQALISSEKESIEDDEILAAGLRPVPDLIRLAYDREQEEASMRAVSLLRQLARRHPVEFEGLVEWLRKADPGWHEAILDETMGKVGGYSEDELREMAAGDIVGTEVRISALVALRARAQERPEMRERTIAFFKELLTRPQAYEAEEEEFTGMLVIESVDLDARELYPEIERVFREDRIEPGLIDLRDIQKDWGLPVDPEPVRREDGLYLDLLCRNCGRTREHFTEYVLVEINTINQQDGEEETAYDPYILDHAVVCPKCEAVDHYEPTGMSRAMLIGPDAMLATLGHAGEKPPEFEPNPRVLYFRSFALDREIHPLEALDEYRLMIASDPRNARNFARMGALLRTLLRYGESLEALRHAHAMAADDVVVILTRARAEHDFGDPEAARALYQSVLDQAKDLPILQRANDETISAMDGLRRLDRAQPSGFEMPVLTLDGEKTEHPSRLVNFQEAGSKKGKPKKRRKRGRRRRGR